MSVIFADPFGSFERGFIRGQDQRMKVEDFELNRRERELALYDKFVFSPQQQLAREQRQFDNQVRLMNMRQSNARRSRARDRDAAIVDQGMYGFAPIGGAASPAARGGNRPPSLTGMGNAGVRDRFSSTFGSTPR